MRTFDCYSCVYLDKTRRKEGNNGTGCYMYGCNQRFSDGYVCGWIRKDNELKTQGCSESNKIKVGIEFLLNETHCIYCGKIRNKEQERYLIYNASTYVSNGYCVDGVEEEWFRKNRDKIQIIKQTEEQFKESKNIAKLYKRRYIEIEEIKEEFLPFC